MNKTKTSEIHVPGWQFWMFSLSVNLIVFAMPAPAVLAQGSANSATETEIANNGQPNNLTDLEPKILAEINRVRTTPQDYARWLEVQRQYYDGIWLRLPGEKPVRTNRGRKALEEAIAFLKEQQPLPALKSSPQTAAAATSELQNFANSNNIQYFSYGRKTATGIVMDLVVDELFPDRRRRLSLLSPNAEDTGVVCKPDPRYAKVCAIAYSDSPAGEVTTNIASAEADVATSQDLTSSEVSNLPPAEAPDENSTSINSTSEPQAETQPTSTTDTAIAKIEQPAPAAEVDTDTNIDTVATLPVPPQPQVPNSTSVNQNDSKSGEAEKATLEEELKLAQAETEIEQKQQELANAEELPEAEDVATKDEPESAAEATEITAEVEAEEPESETESADAAESLENENEAEARETVAEAAKEVGTEVAINTETAGLGARIEQGVLETGDRVIADDGSLYDFYPLQGKAGESFTIYLESDDFDAFVALVDSNGKTIGENDDISQENSNSQIEITLPADGVYNVIVNTYDENGTGEYTLKVSQ